MKFKDRVYHIAAQIPKGKVATYGQLARLAGNARASRAVGMFMKRNPFAPRVPCHRVVAFDGKLTGFTASGGIRRKEKMLRNEGVVFTGNRVNLDRSIWKK